MVTILLLTMLVSTLPGEDVPPSDVLRVATFNASLNREHSGSLLDDLASPDDPQIRNVAEIIQRVRPDILLINEFDHDAEGRAATLFQRHYLAVSQNGAEPIDFPHRFQGPVNTGVASGFDLDNDGQVVLKPGERGYGNDALGFGQFPGQYGMLLLSRFPIDEEKVRSFQRVLWKDMPGAVLPVREDGEPWYSEEELAVLRLSSKSHWDVPIRVGERTLHILASHPTPPAFDGPEARNARRNHDEIRLWADYLSGGPQASYLGDCLDPDASFVVLGDQNADPRDGTSVDRAIRLLLDHPRVNSQVIPASQGGVEASTRQAGANEHHQGDPAQDTADFNDREVGNLRVDYVLPSRDLVVTGSGIFWPREDDPLGRLVRMVPDAASSDHRLVYLDIRLPAGPDAR